MKNQQRTVLSKSNRVGSSQAAPYGGNKALEGKLPHLTLSSSLISSSVFALARIHVLLGSLSLTQLSSCVYESVNTNASHASLSHVSLLIFVTLLSFLFTSSSFSTTPATFFPLLFPFSSLRPLTQVLLILNGVKCIHISLPYKRPLTLWTHFSGNVHNVNRVQ